LIIKKASHVFFASWLQAPLNFLASIIVANILGVAGKGYSVIFVSSVNLVGVLLLIGLPASCIYFIQRKKILIEKIYFTFQVFTIFIFFFTLILIFLIDVLSIIGYDYSISEKIIFVLCIYFFLNNNLLITIILGIGKSKYYSKLIVFKSFAFLFFVILFLIFFDLGLLGYFIAYVSAEAIYFIFIQIVLFKKLNLQVKNFSIIKPNQFYDIFVFSIKNFPNSIIALFQNSLVNYLILFVLDIEAVGLFSIAISFHNLINSIPRAINTLLFGEASRSNIKQANYILLQTIRILNSLMLFIIFFSILFVGPIINIFYGVNFENSITPAKIMIFCALLTGNISTMQSYQLAFNEPLRISVVNFSNVVISSILILFLTDYFNVIGVAMSFALSKICIFVYMTEYFKNKKVFKNFREIFFVNIKDMKEIKKSFKL